MPGIEPVRLNLAGLLPLAGFACAALLACGAAAFAQSPPPLARPSLDLRTRGQVRAIVRQPDGGIVVGGRFDWVDGVPRGNLARLLPDGSLDAEWNPPTNGLVRAIAVDAGGTVYVGGDFTSVGAASRFCLAKLSGTGVGAVDANWSPAASFGVMALAVADDTVYVGGSFSQVAGRARSYVAKLSATSGAVDETWNPAADSYVSTLAIGADGYVYAGGYFGNIGGQPRGHVARLAAGGTGAADAAWNPFADGSVSALGFAADGSVYAGGSFSNIGGQQRHGIAKLSASGAGAADADWNPAADDAVETLVVDAAGAVYAGGNFGNIGDQPRSHVARLSGSGTGAADENWNPSADSYVLALAFGNDGGILAGGEFTAIGGQARQALAQLDATGAAGAATDAEQVGSVFALARQPDGGVIVGGSFAHASGVQRDNLLRLNADGTLDTQWDPAPDRQVRALAVDADGSVYVGGQFYNIGGQSRQAIAKVSGSGLGVADATWNPAADTDVYALALAADGAVYAAGAFSGIGGKPRNRIAKLDGAGSGAADATWNPSASGGNVEALAVDGDGSVYAGGRFTGIGAQPRNYLAKLAGSGTGAADATWNPTATGAVTALALGDGAVYAGGEFTNIGGQSRRYLARLSGSGTGAADATWDPSPNGWVYALAADGSDALYVGGNFSVIGDQIAYFLAKLGGTGTGVADALWIPSPDGRVQALLFGGSAVHAGGAFIHAGGQARSALAAFPAFERLFYDGFE